MAVAAFWCRICFRFFTMCGAGPMVLRSLHLLVSHVRRCAMTVGDVRCMHLGAIHSFRRGEHPAHDTSHLVSTSVKSCTIRQSCLCWVQLRKTVVPERASLQRLSASDRWLHSNTRRHGQQELRQRLHVLFGFGQSGYYKETCCAKLLIITDKMRAG